MNTSPLAPWFWRRAASARLYAVTTNPPYARGESIAMAARAGAMIGDAEFVQFHPTAIDVGLDPAPLATEALRGEGATLVNAAGERFMTAIDPRRRAGAARRRCPRRVCRDRRRARRISSIAARPSARALPNAFPTVFALCQTAGIDPARQLIPVAPAAHYHMGGIATDARGALQRAGPVGGGRGRLYRPARRQPAGVEFAARSRGVRRPRRARHPQPRPQTRDAASGWSCSASPTTAPTHSAARGPAVARLRRTMSDHVGVVRDAAGLKKAIAVLRLIERQAGGDRVLANMALAARFIATGALLREESRGAQARSDHPEASPTLPRALPHSRRHR